MGHLVGGIPGVRRGLTLDHTFVVRVLHVLRMAVNSVVLRAVRPCCTVVGAARRVENTLGERGSRDTQIALSPNQAQPIDKHYDRRRTRTPVIQI